MKIFINEYKYESKRFNQEVTIIDEIYKQIEIDNKAGQYKSFIPHFMCVEDKIVNQLINDGFKVSKGEYMRGDNGLIIEW